MGFDLVDLAVSICDTGYLLDVLLVAIAWFNCLLGVAAVLWLLVYRVFVLWFGLTLVDCFGCILSAVCWDFCMCF